MKLSKFFYFMLVAFVSASALTFTSCSDDDDDNVSSSESSYLNGDYYFTFNGDTCYYGYQEDYGIITVNYFSSGVTDLSVNSYDGASAEGTFWFGCTGYTDYDDLSYGALYKSDEGDKVVDFDIFFEGISDVKALEKGQELSFATLYYKSSETIVKWYASEQVVSSDGLTINEWHVTKASSGKVTVEDVIVYDDDDTFYVILNFDNVTYKAESLIDNWDEDAVVDGQIIFWGDDNITY